MTEAGVCCNRAVAVFAAAHIIRAGNRTANTKRELLHQLENRFNGF